MTSPRSGSPVANQFEVETPEGRYFQSYHTMIAFRDHSGNLTLDRDGWEYSTTTAKYRNQFTGLTTAETRRMVKDGTIKLDDLN